ncbi:MAG: NAD(P)-dependent oxidoreductase [Desulfatibacillum sp.]|nr:NAD(P)-dependent oxidoreductase [Desulfatibacillum sp.]
MPKRLNLVTGACGFSGSHLVKMLLSQGQEVIATDLPKAFSHPKIQTVCKGIDLDFSQDGCQVLPSDLLDKSSLDALFKRPVTHVFHTASLYDYSAPLSLLRKINVEGSSNFFETAGSCKSLERFVHWSTCGVFGKPVPASGGDKCNLPFSEDNSSPKNSVFGQKEPENTYLVNDYSVSKWEQEQFAWKLYRAGRLPLTVVRPAPLYGPGSDYGHGGIVLAINRGLLPFIPADSVNYLTTSLHVEDMAGLAVHVAEKDFALGEDYNVVDESVISYHEFLHYLALLLGRRLWDIPLVRQRYLKNLAVVAAHTWLFLEQRFQAPRVRVFEVGSATYMASSYWISNKKSKDAGYVYQHPDVKEGMRTTIEWFRRMGWLQSDYNPKGVCQDNF